MVAKDLVYSAQYIQQLAGLKQMYVQKFHLKPYPDSSDNLMNAFPQWETPQSDKARAKPPPPPRAKAVDTSTVDYDPEREPHYQVQG